MWLSTTRSRDERVRAPRLGDQLLAGEDAAARADEGLQQPELQRRQRPSTSAPRRISRATEVHLGVADPHGSAASRCLAAPRRSARDPRAQLARAERLGDVVVGAQLEAEHLLGLLRPRREHQDRRRHAARAAARGTPRSRPCRAA